MAARGSFSAISCPDTVMRPSVDAYTPETILTNVDLPLPFSPARQRISPSLMTRSMPSRARPSANDLERFSTTGSGCITARSFIKGQVLAVGRCRTTHRGANVGRQRDVPSGFRLEVRNRPHELEGVIPVGELTLFEHHDGVTAHELTVYNDRLIALVAEVDVVLDRLALQDLQGDHVGGISCAGRIPGLS